MIRNVPLTCCIYQHCRTIQFLNKSRKGLLKRLLCTKLLKVQERGETMNWTYSNKNFETTRYSIKDLERISGVKAHTIRIWEKRYHIVSPQRTDTNIRYYSDSDLKRVLNISILNRCGLKISYIAKLSENEISGQVKDIIQSKLDTESEIENMLVAMLDLDEQKFTKAMNRTIVNYGFENAFLQTVYPFFQRVGVLWQINSIDPSHEHFVSALVKQKLMVAIDSIIPDERENPRKFVLFLRDKELHDLGLLFYSYIIRKRGHRVAYLGQHLPLKDLAAFCEIYKPDYLMTAFMNAFSNDEMESYINKLSLSFEEQTIFITGYQANEYGGELPSNVQYVNSYFDFRTLLDEIK